MLGALAITVSACVSCGRDCQRVVLPVVDPCVPTGPVILAVDYSPTWSQDAARIAYVHVGDSAGVYTVDTAGTNPRWILQGGAAGATELSWSPDGSRIAMRYLGNIWTLDVATGGLRQWTDKADVFPHWPGWSPEGRYLTYSIIARPAGAPESAWGLHVIDTQDGAERALLHDGYATLSGSRGAWSPDGRWIIAAVPLTETVYGTEKVIYELFALSPVQGSAYHRLTALQGSARNPEWSPDGSLLFFDFIPPPCNQLESRRETWVMNSDGSGIRKWGVNLSDPGVTRSFPFAISRVNGRCASVGLDSTGRHGVIVTQNLDGSGRRQVTSGPTDTLATRAISTARSALRVPWL